MGRCVQCPPTTTSTIVQCLVISMEQKSSNMYISCLSLCLRILMWDWEIRIKGLLSIFFFFLKLLSTFFSQNWKASTKTRNCSNSEPVKQNVDCVQSGVRLCKEDVIVVMERLGMNVEWGGDGIEEFGAQEIGQLLEEDATLAEVEEAFDVFDQSKDGFIDSRELQRVLSCLGLEKDLMECQKMINAVDQNGDGLIDHNEFVRILEESFG